HDKRFERITTAILILIAVVNQYSTSRFSSIIWYRHLLFFPFQNHSDGHSQPLNSCPIRFPFQTTNTGFYPLPLAALSLPFQQLWNGSGNPHWFSGYRPQEPHWNYEQQ